MAEISAIGLDEEFAGCPAHWVPSIAAYIDERFGGVVMYLRLIGISAGSETPIIRVLKGDGTKEAEGRTSGDLETREEDELRERKVEMEGEGIEVEGEVEVAEAGREKQVDEIGLKDSGGRIL